MPCMTVGISMSLEILRSIESKIELHCHADTSVMGNNCQIIHDHEMPLHAYSYYPSDGHKSVRIIYAIIDYLYTR